MAISSEHLLASKRLALPLRIPSPGEDQQICPGKSSEENKMEHFFRGILLGELIIIEENNNNKRYALCPALRMWPPGGSAQGGGGERGRNVEQKSDRREDYLYSYIFACPCLK